MLRLGVVIVSLGFVLSLQSCYQGDQGCMDPHARNFNAGADRDCCCTYYNLDLTIAHKWINATDTIAFSPDSTFYDQNNHAFQLLSMPIYVSDVHLVKSNGIEAGVKNTVAVYNSTGSSVIENNFALVNISTLGATLGDISRLDTFTQLKFFIGLSPNANHIIASSMASGHPLSATTAGSLYLSETDGYVFMNPKIKIGADTLNFPVSGDANRLTVVLNFPQPVIIADGQDANFSIGIDYHKFFAGTDFINDTQQAVINRIIQQAVSAFYLK